MGSQGGLESALLLRLRTDLLDNGLTESLTHGARDFLGGYRQVVEGEGGKGRGRSVGRSVVLDVEARRGKAERQKCGGGGRSGGRRRGARQGKAR